MHLFARGSDITWQFCLVLFLAAFTEYKNLIIVSTFNLFSGLATCLTGEYVGNFIDKNSRLFTARVFVWVQNTSVFAATIFCYLLLKMNDDHKVGGHETEIHGEHGRLKEVPISLNGIIFLIGVHVFGALANILDQA